VTSRKRSNRPTMADVARSAGVSVATVSYVIGGRGGDRAASRISEDTRQRVLAAIADIGYRVNEHARNLRRQRTDRILLLIDRLSSPYDQRFATEVEAVLNSHGLKLSIVVCPTLDKLVDALDMIPRGLADAAIIQPWGFVEYQHVLTDYARQHVPMVAVGNLEPAGFDVVANEEVQAINDAVDHLVARGHHRIGFIGHRPQFPNAEHRLDQVRRRLSVHGIELPDSYTRPGARDRNHAYVSTIELLKGDEPPSAIFSASDTGAIAAIWAAHALSLRIPGDIAIVGCGNVDEGRITFPTLSSAGPSNPDFSPVAQLLIERLASPESAIDRRLLIPWQFFPRASS
jgi:DNA-binding LacI/PurR family transcriptional regulator